MRRSVAWGYRFVFFALAVLLPMCGGSGDAKPPSEKPGSGYVTQYMSFDQALTELEGIENDPQKATSTVQVRKSYVLRQLFVHLRTLSDADRSRLYSYLAPVV